MPEPSVTPIPLGCADFSFPLLEHEHALDLIEMLGVEGVDLGLMGGRSHVRPEEIRDRIPLWAGRLAERLQSRGLVPADVFLIPWTDFERMAPNHPEARERDDAAALFRDVLELAAALEAPGMTLLPGIHWPDEPYEDSLARAAEELAWRVAEGREAGVRVSVEAHVGSVADTPAKTLALVGRCPGLELTLDYTHFVFQGIEQAEIEPLVAHARHFHARGACPGTLQASLRENTIDFGRVIEAMRETGYDGFLGLEFVWTPGEGAYDLSRTDNVSETLLLRDLLRAELAR